MITQRDKTIERFIEEFKCANRGQLQKLFIPSLRQCQKRLQILVESGRIKRFRPNMNADFVYYVGRKPREVDHMLARVDAYIDIQKHFNLRLFRTEWNEIDYVRPDAYFIANENGYNVGYFLEVQLSRYFMQEKYEKAYRSGAWIGRWQDFPSVLVYTPHKIALTPSAINYIFMRGGADHA